MTVPCIERLGVFRQGQNMEVRNRVRGGVGALTTLISAYVLVGIAVVPMTTQIGVQVWTDKSMLYHRRKSITTTATAATAVKPHNVPIRVCNTTSPTAVTTRDDFQQLESSFLLSSCPSSLSQRMCTTPMLRLDDPPQGEYSNRRELHYLFTGPGLYAETTTAVPSSQTNNSIRTPVPAAAGAAVCHFQTMDAFTFHFPHAMQQLYRCWSWWRLHNTLAAILVFPRSEMPPNNAFLTGFVSTLQAAIGLRLVRPSQPPHQPPYRASVEVHPRVPHNRVHPDDIFAMRDPTRPYYAFHQVDDAQVLRDTIVQQLRSAASSSRRESPTTRSSVMLDKATAFVPESSPLSPSCHSSPRIAILNRHQHREWVSAVAFVERFAQRRRIDSNHNQNNNTVVPIVYFHSDTTFADQVQFFVTTDILISPHGAQLTGLAFLPDCGAVLEVFPAGYYLPHFFGSLARASNHPHRYVTLVSHGTDWPTEAVAGMQTQAARQKARNKQLCPDPDTIVHAVENMVAEWHECCRSLVAKPLMDNS